jgi:hypothetical protein
MEYLVVKSRRAQYLVKMVAIGIRDKNLTEVIA